MLERLVTEREREIEIEGRKEKAGLEGRTNCVMLANKGRPNRGRGYLSSFEFAQ